MENLEDTFIVVQRAAFIGCVGFEVMTTSDDLSNIQHSKLEFYLVVLSFFLALLSLGGLWSSPAIFLRIIEQEYNIDIVLTSMVFVVMLLPVPFTELIVHPLKKYGEDFTVLIGMVLLSFLGTVSPFIANYWLFLAIRFLSASGFGLLFMNHNKILTRYTPEESKTKNTLILMCGLVSGAFGSSYLSIFLYKIFNESWVLSIAFWGVIGILATFLWIIYMKLTEDRK
ncbi:MAG: MFS transporter [Candidatus Hodarchaeales archaeon]